MTKALNEAVRLCELELRQAAWHSTLNESETKEKLLRYFGPLVEPAGREGGEPTIVEDYLNRRRQQSKEEFEREYLNQPLPVPAPSEPAAEGERVTDRDGSGLSASDNSPR